MKRLHWLVFGVAAGAAVGSQVAAGGSVPDWITNLYPGGDATHTGRTRDAYSRHVPTMPVSDLTSFAVGNRIFNTSWVEAPASVSSFDGLGPYFSRRSCSGCHTRDGRGRPPDAPDEITTSMVVKLARMGTEGIEPDSAYGTQLSERAVLGLVPEGRLRVHWEHRVERYPDGRTVELRHPTYDWGELADGAVTGTPSPRLAPSVFGMGLLEAVPTDSLRAWADPEDADGDSVSGRIHRPDGIQVGRFGWKATEATVADQAAAALIGDMGITNPLHPHEHLMPRQSEARDLITPTELEINQKRFDQLVFYSRTLAPPMRDASLVAKSARGGRLFDEVGCTSCHVPSARTSPDADAALADQLIHPFTDLLLHDLGDGLDDGMREHDAESAEWRTAPLWGIGIAERVNGYRFLLHDGRARTVEEAILWHEGEAAPTTKRFRELSETDRVALIGFVESL